MRIAVVLPGLHRVNRGAETAFESLGRELARRSDCDVTLFGSGRSRPGEPYDFVSVPQLRREAFERWPRLPALRSETAYEELTFALNLLRRFRPDDFDATISCSYPHVNWLLRTRRSAPRRPINLFVTQNGDWAPQARNSEYRLFTCDGLVCTNPDYFARNRERWKSVLIPNGVDPELFHPAPAQRARFGLPEGVPVALMVSALIPSKRVLEAVAAVGGLSDVHLAVAGDGPQRDEVLAAGQSTLGERFHLFNLPREVMPDLYRSADLFLHMSKDEPSANAYIEALASGLPIVTHDREVTRWTLEDSSRLVDTDDADAVRSAIQEALRADRQACAERQRRLVDERFTWAGIAAQYRAFLEDLRAEPAGERGGV
jgi:glycosyltransferase involved in cell wall biosynthesis